MQGKTTIKQKQTGNLDTQQVQRLIEAPDAGASLCAGGYNPFGRHSVSQECADFMTVDATLTREFNQQILQGYVTGDLFELPAGVVSVVFGYENRRFDYDLDPGSVSGPFPGLILKIQPQARMNSTISSLKHLFLWLKTRSLQNLWT